MIDKKLKIIKVCGIDGYRLGNIQECITLEKYRKMRSWLIGQTVGDYRGEPVVYVHDYERFLRGLSAELNCETRSRTCNVLCT